MFFVEDIDIVVVPVVAAVFAAFSLSLGCNKITSFPSHEVPYLPSLITLSLFNNALAPPIDPSATCLPNLLGNYISILILFILNNTNGFKLKRMGFLSSYRERSVSTSSLGEPLGYVVPYVEALKDVVQAMRFCTPNLEVNPIGDNSPSLHAEPFPVL